MGQQSEPEIESICPAPPSKSAAFTSGGASSQRRARSPNRKKSRLSCISCRRSKVKCDKSDPCSRCVRLGAVCAPSSPSGAPRGRNGGRRKADHKLLDRIAKLENLVKGMEVRYTGEISRRIEDENKEVSDKSKRPALGVKSVNSAQATPKDGLDRYLGTSVWMSLSDEIHGIYEILNEPSDNEDGECVITPDSGSPCADQTSESSFIICDSRILPNTERPKHPSRSQVKLLYSAFMTNVDPVVKILHGPSLQRYLVEQTGEFDCSPGPRGWEALKFAIYYSAITSLTHEECLMKLGEERDMLLSRYRLGTEIGLARADFINTGDVSTLQALVLYLSALRSNDTSRRTWTMTGLAVRIAHALGLHLEMYGGKYLFPHQPFEREMRRRLWWQICNLDRHASADRGSDPIITPKSFSTQLPLNVNDIDLIPGDPREVCPRDEYTDFTISLVIHEVFDIERRLNYVLAGESDSLNERSDDPLDMRRYWGLVCEQRIQDKYLRHCNMAIPIQRYTMVLADSVFATLKLWIYRPLQRSRYSPTRVTIPHSWILHVSLDVVEKINKVLVDPSARPFKWLTTIWISWHALAVMIAELCVQTEGPLVERAWSLVDIVFEDTARHIADSHQGRLWRPIRKLMNRAQAVRKKHLTDSSSIAGPLLSGIPRTTSPPASSRNTHVSNINNMESPPERWSNVPSNMPERVQHQQSSNAAECASVGWDPWEATVPSSQLNYSSDLNQLAWTNWETFIDELQTDGSLLPGQAFGIPPLFNML